MQTHGGPIAVLQQSDIGYVEKLHYYSYGVPLKSSYAYVTCGAHAKGSVTGQGNALLRLARSCGPQPTLSVLCLSTSRSLALSLEVCRWLSISSRWAFRRLHSGVT